MVQVCWWNTTGPGPQSGHGFGERAAGCAGRGGSSRGHPLWKRWQLLDTSQLLPHGDALLPDFYVKSLFFLKCWQLFQVFLMEGEKCNLWSHSVASTLAQNNNKACYKSTLYMVNETHLKTRFGLQPFSLHLLCVFLAGRDNRKWWQTVTESFSCARHSAMFYIYHLILTITQRSMSYYYYPVLQIQALRLREIKYLSWGHMDDMWQVGFKPRALLL